MEDLKAIHHYNLNSSSGITSFAKDYAIWYLILKYIETKEQVHINNIKRILKMNDITDLNKPGETFLGSNSIPNKIQESSILDVSIKSTDGSRGYKRVKKLF